MVVDKSSPAYKLTKTEQRVLERIAWGWRSEDIARDMAVSRRTVDAHRRNLLKKLKASGVADLTRFAIRSGLIELESERPDECVTQDRKKFRHKQD